MANNRAVEYAVIAHCYEIGGGVVPGFRALNAHASAGFGWFKPEGLVLERGGSRFANFVMAVDGLYSAYCSPARAPPLLSEAGRIYFFARGCRMNEVSPGIIKSPIHNDAVKNLHPVQQMGEISEIALAVVYLDSANYLTGEILHE